MVRNGARLKSQVCETQVIVVRAAESLDDLRAGGVEMVELDAPVDGGTEVDPEYSGGSVLGKRYVTDDGGEILVTKAGAGALSVARTLLAIKEAKPLPASD